MDEPMSKPCAHAVRIERLAAADPEDLSSDEREELNQYIRDSQECAMLYQALRNEFRQMDRLIRSFPAEDSVPRFSPPPLKPRSKRSTTQLDGEQLTLPSSEDGSFAESIEEELMHSSVTRQLPKEDDEDIHISDLDIGNPHILSIRSLVGQILAVAAVLIVAFVSLLLFVNLSNRQESRVSNVSYTPTPTVISHNRTIPENKLFRCGSCGEPGVMVILTEILVQGDREHVVLYMRVINETTQSVGVMFTTIQFRDPDGNVINAIANNPPSLFVNARASESLTVAFDLTPKPGVAYKLDLVLSKVRAWDNIYQSENIIFS